MSWSRPSFSGTFHKCAFVIWYQWLAPLGLESWSYVWSETVVPNLGYAYLWEYTAGCLGIHEKKLDNHGKQTNNSNYNSNQFCSYDSVQFMEIGCQAYANGRMLGTTDLRSNVPLYFSWDVLNFGFGWGWILEFKKAKYISQNALDWNQLLVAYPYLGTWVA